MDSPLRFLDGLPRDARLLLAARVVRLFAYGFLSVVLALYLAQLGLSETQIGLVFSLTLAGDVVVSLWMTTSADALGRRRMLRLGAGLMLLAGVVFTLTGEVVLLVAAAIVGVISPSGGEIGPFLSIEQAALSQLVPDSQRTRTFAWTNVFGSLAAALGVGASGATVQVLQAVGWGPLRSTQTVVLGYALLGAVLWWLFGHLSSEIEKAPQASPTPVARRLGLHRSRRVVLRLSALFSLDAFAGGFVVQSFVAYWFYTRFSLEPVLLGAIFFGANLLAAASSLVAAWLAKRIGLINTMVWTHIPANVLLVLVPLMPNVFLAMAVLLARACLSQMDVPTRQSYTLAVVAPDERSAAAGITTIARSLGGALSPALTGLLLSGKLLAAPFFLAGGLKVAYDLMLYASFRRMKPPEETTNVGATAEGVLLKTR